MRVPLNTQAPLTLPGMLSTAEHCDQSRVATRCSFRALKICGLAVLHNRYGFFASRFNQLAKLDLSGVLRQRSHSEMIAQIGAYLRRLYVMIPRPSAQTCPAPRVGRERYARKLPVPEWRRAANCSCTSRRSPRPLNPPPTLSYCSSKPAGRCRPVLVTSAATTRQLAFRRHGITSMHLDAAAMQARLKSEVARGGPSRRRRGARDGVTPEPHRCEPRLGAGRA